MDYNYRQLGLRTLVYKGSRRQSLDKGEAAPDEKCRMGSDCEKIIGPFSTYCDAPDVCRHRIGLSQGKIPKHFRGSIIKARTVIDSRIAVFRHRQITAADKAIFWFEFLIFNFWSLII